MNILFTICGRGGSKGVKNKNIRPFLGKPLFQHTVCAINCYIQEYQTIDESYDIIISTDSSEFLQMAENQGDHLTRLRPAELAQDASPKMPAILDAVRSAEKQTKKKYQHVIDLDITSPIRTVKEIRNAFDKKIEKPEIDVVYSVVPARRNPYFNMIKKEGDSYTRVISSDVLVRQEAPECYDMNASIYVYDIDFLASGAKHPLDGRSDIILMKDLGVIDIDSEEDFEMMVWIAERLKNTHEEYRKIFS